MKRISNRSSWRFRLLVMAIVIVCSTGMSLHAAKETYTLNFDHQYELTPTPGVAGRPASETLQYTVDCDGTNMYGQPLKKVFFRIPLDATDVSVKVVSKEIIRIVTIGHPLTEQNIVKSDGSIVKRKTPEDIGVKHNEQDAQLAQIDNDSKIGNNMRIIGVIISPSEYNPGNLTLTEYDNINIEVDWTTKEPELTNMKDWKPKSSLEAALNPCIVNNGKITEPFFISGKYYYIITPDSLKGSLEKLARWKRQKGYDVTVKTIEEIRKDKNLAINPQEGIEDDAERLRTYLLYEYSLIHQHDDGNAKDMFCLLVGDHNLGMPIRRIQSSIDTVFNLNEHIFSNAELYTYGFVPTDNYFSDITTNLNLISLTVSHPENLLDRTNYSAYLKNEDIYNPSIAVGRLLCHTPEEVLNYTDKLILYESYPGRGDLEYLDKAYAFQHYELARRGEAENVFDEMTYLEKQSKHIINEFDFYPNILNYESGIYNKPGEPTGTDVIEQMRGHGFLSWHGHGQPGSISVSGDREATLNVVPNLKLESTCSYNTKKNYGIKALSGYSWTECGIECEPGLKDGLDAMGNEDYPSVAYSVACTIVPMGPISQVDSMKNFKILPQPDVNMGRSFTSYGKYGGPAIIANTRNGIMVRSADLETEFIKALKLSRKIGIANAIAKVKFASKDSVRNHVLTTNILIGDPEFDVWLGAPDSLNINVYQTSGGIHFMGEDLREATVSVYDGEEVLSSQKITETSSYVSIPSWAFGNCLLVSVWKSGFLPFQKIIFRDSGIANSPTFDIVNLSLAQNNAGESTSLKSGSDITINVIGKEIISDPLTLQSESRLHINGGKELNIASKLSGEGDLFLSGRSVTLQCGFEVKVGANLFITNNIKQ